ncbi:uncharacterized protein TNCV_367731 [Trichonephila clavipes]|nr:uncharacterized protein TNCV_367731 [Trichonephila clavipes]
MKADSALRAATAVCRSEGRHLQPNCQQPRHTGPTPGVMVWGCFSNTTRITLAPHTTVVTQRALQSVGMLPWLARSPDLSVIEHVWDIIGLQLQHYPQPALAALVLTQQLQQAWNPIPQSEIRHLNDTMHADLN